MPPPTTTTRPRRSRGREGSLAPRLLLLLCAAAPPLLPLLAPLPLADALGYLKTPRSRNLVAFEDTVWWPRTETDPEPETTPQGLDRGGTLAQCGVVETLRNYDRPKNVFGDLMPINVQAVYEQEGAITLEVSLISSNGGHFRFSACPIEWGEIPTQACFDAHPLEFVKDNYYGATEDPNYPERIYVPDGDVTGRVEDSSGFPGNKQEFSYEMNLPCGLHGDLVLLQWYFVTAQDCYHEGYPEYDFPPEWGDVFEEKIEPCPDPLPPDGNGLPLQYWNCAEVQILKTGETERCAPTGSPTGGPTKRETGEPTPAPAADADEPTVEPSGEPTLSPAEVRPAATCDEICLVPADEDECPPGLDDSLHRCRDPLSGKTVLVGDICFAGGECGTSAELDNCPGGLDAYKRVASCAKDDRGETPEDTAVSLPVLDNDVDGVGEGLTIVDWTEPSNGTVELSEGALVYTPDPGYNGPDEFEYSVIDGNGFLSDAKVEVDVTPVNDAPVAEDDVATTPMDTNVYIPVLENDSDPDGSFAIDSIVDQPANGSAGIRPDGTIVYKPDPGFVGTDAFAYRICDEEGACDEAEVTVRVEPPPNNPPVANDDAVTISEGLNPGPTIPVLANDEDPDGDELIVTEVGEPESGTVEISEDGKGVVYTPDEGFTGTDSFEYTACDPGGLCDTATVTMTVDPKNDGPIVFDDRESTPEGQPLEVDVLANDLPDVGLAVTEVSQPGNGTCEVTEGGTVLFTPNEDFFGRDECSYTACLEGTDICGEGTVIVDVVEAPKQPPLAVDDPVTTDEDQPVTLDPLLNDKSPSEGPLTLSDVQNGQNGTCVINDDNTVTYTPDAGYSGIDLCLYTVCDDSNGLCDEGAIVVSVQDTNEPPDARDDSVTTPFGTPILVDVIANDVDPDGDTLTITDITQGLHGTCTITDDNQILYVPELGYSGPDICPYVVCDDSNECDTANLFVEVGPGPPVAENDKAETDPDTPKIVDVIQNDSHPTEPIQVTDIISQPDNGKCEVVDGKVQYTPDEGHVGTDACTYQVCVEGSTDICSEADLVVDTIEPIEPPAAGDDTAETSPETPVVVDVVQNDSHPTKPIQVTDITSQPDNGKCEVIDGKVQYTPDEGHIGTDTCTYQVCVEGSANICSEADLVVDTIELPIAEDDKVETEPETPVVVDVVQNDSHPTKPIQVTGITSQPDNGKCEVNDGKVQYTPDEGHIGADICTYQVCVEGSTDICSEADVVVDTIERKNPPVAEDDTAETSPETPVDVDVVQNDSHPTDPIQVTDITLQPNNGSCEVIDGKVQYTPDEGYVGTDTCTYQVCIEGRTDICSQADLVVDVIVDPPIARDDKERTPVDTPVASFVVGNDFHPDPETDLEITDVTQPDNGSCDFSADGYIFYTPNEGFQGSDSCEYTVCVEGTSACDTATLVVDVVEVKIAEDDQVETPQGEPVLVDVLDNDSYPEDANKPLVITGVAEADNGICAVIVNQIQYTPNEDFTGIDSCEYTVCVDVEGAQVCDMGTLTIDVIPKPIASNDEAETIENTPVLVDVTSNDEPQLPEKPLEVTDITTQPKNGSCEVEGGKVQYNPEEGFVGLDSCVYSVCLEGTQLCDEGTLTIEVNPAPVLSLSPTAQPSARPSSKPTAEPMTGNTRPFAMDDVASTPASTPVDIDVLQNDFDFDGDVLSVIQTTQPTNGQVKTNPDGTVLYIPNDGFAGDDSFKYIISDGKGGTAEATVTVSVVEPASENPPPTMRPTMKPSARPTLKPSSQALRCDDLCFEPLEPEECPSCDPIILPSCSNATLGLGELCESDGECGLNDQLNNCEGTFDVYRRVPCTTPNVPICRPRDGESITLSASGDAHIAANYSDRVFNHETILINEYPKSDGLIKWELSQEICECITIKKATLRLWVVDPSRAGGFVHVMNPTWDEDTVTWHNAPESSGPPLGKIGQALNETWVELDVTGLISNSDEQVAVRIKSCLRNQVQYASKEYQQGNFAPQLEIEFGPPPSGLPLLTSNLGNGRNFYGRRLGGSPRHVSGRRSRAREKKWKKSGSSSKSESDSFDSGSGDSSENVHDESQGIVQDTPVCPYPSNLSNARMESAIGDSTIVHREETQVFGSDPLMELSPHQCGAMHVMVNFPWTSVQSSMVEYASILIHVIEGSDLVGATFLHAPSPVWEEGSVTWQNAPEYDKVIGSLSTVENGMWYEIDVTPFISLFSYDHLSIRIVPAAVNKASCEDLRLIFASKELGHGFGPQIVVVPKTVGSAGLSVEQRMQNPSHSDIFANIKPGYYAGEKAFSDCSAGNNLNLDGKLVIKPMDDSYVSPRRKRLNHGNEPMLFVDGKAGNVAMMRFDLSCLRSKFITSAVLKLFSIDGSPNGGTINVLTHDDDSDWAENMVTWNNAPLNYNNVAQIRRVRTGTWREVDISKALSSGVGHYVTITLNSDGINRVVYSSKEGGNSPQLIITYDDYKAQPRQQPVTCDIPGAESLTIPPTDDALLKEEEGDTNFSHMINLNARYILGSRVHSLLKFEFSCLYTESTVSRAILRLYCKNGSPEGGKILTMLGSWREETVTWKNAPSTPTNFYADVGRVNQGEWVEVDVSSAVTSMEDYEITFRIEGLHQNAVVYGSKEDEHAPTLEIFFGRL